MQSAMTKVGDVVLVYMDSNPVFFARVEAISSDVKRGWFQLKLLVLQIPLLTVTWILREAYFNGVEFTMGGRPMRIERVIAPAEEDSETKPDDDTEKDQGKPELVVPEKRKEGKTGRQGKVISISDRRKQDRE